MAKSRLLFTFVLQENIPQSCHLEDEGHRKGHLKKSSSENSIRHSPEPVEEGLQLSLKIVVT